MRVNRNMAWDVQHGAKMQRQLLIALGGGIASALLSLGLLTGAGGLAMIAYFAPLALFLVGFMAGANALAIAGGIACAVLIYLGGLAIAAVYFGSILVPAWIVVYHALSHRFLATGGTDHYSTGEIVSRVAALGAVVVMAITLAVTGVQGGIEDSIRGFVSASFAQIMPVGPTDPGGEVVERIVPLFPAFATLSWLAMLIINAALAQALLVRWGKAMRPSPRYSAIDIPDWANWAIVGAATLKLASSDDLEYLAQNLVVILAGPFFLVGLAIAHSLVHRLKMPGLALGLFYFALMIFAWFPAALAALGFAEQWVRLRDRYGHTTRALAPHNQSEDE